LHGGAAMLGLRLQAEAADAALASRQRRRVGARHTVRCFSTVHWPKRTDQTTCVAVRPACAGGRRRQTRASFILEGAVGRSSGCVPPMRRDQGAGQGTTTRNSRRWLASVQGRVELAGPAQYKPAAMRRTTHGRVRSFGVACRSGLPPAGTASAPASQLIRHSPAPVTTSDMKTKGTQHEPTA
jgi:hypothetical protein